jgi:hypothetical protein
MRSFAPRRVTASSTTQEDSTNGSPLLYKSLALVIPEDGYWIVRGVASMSSTNIADAKRLLFYMANTGQIIYESQAPGGDGAIGQWLPYTANWEARLRKGDEFQLYAIQNGASIIRIGGASVSPFVQRITATRIG